MRPGKGHSVNARVQLVEQEAVSQGRLSASIFIVCGSIVCGSWAILLILRWSAVLAGSRKCEVGPGEESVCRRFVPTASGADERVRCYTGLHLVISSRGQRDRDRTVR